MNPKLKELLGPMVITLLILIVLEIFTTALIPLLGVTQYVLPFNILIVLYLGFKLDSPWLALLILIAQYTHSLFSIEGWEIGTIAGVIVCVTISYLRDMIHFNSRLMTVIIVQVFQLVWLLILSGLLLIKTGDMDYIQQKFWRFIPESLAISLFAPMFFSILDKVWKSNEEGMLGERG